MFTTGHELTRDERIELIELIAEAKRRTQAHKTFSHRYTYDRNRLEFFIDLLKEYDNTHTGAGMRRQTGDEVPPSTT